MDENEIWDDRGLAKKRPNVRGTVDPSKNSLTIALFGLAYSCLVSLINARCNAQVNDYRSLCAKLSCILIINP
jgi:hypothetical protein